MAKCRLKISLVSFNLYRK